jgi:pimeloyl-ACP methyl ester carboxylesterase
MPPRWILLIVRACFAILGILSPRAAGALALRIFCTPHRHVRPHWERDVASRGRRQRVGPGLAAHSWGSGPNVLLVHGWEGRGTQLGHFVEPLVTAGCRVIAFDGPAHGASEGVRTDLLEFTECLRRIGRDLGPLAGVIAHSFGGVTTTLAIERGLDAACVVLIATPASVEDVLARFAALIGLRGRSLQAFRQALERQTRVAVREVEIHERVAALKVPALIVHDRRDREVPFGDAERLVARWPGARLLATDGLGHRRILKDPAVIRHVVSFVDAERTVLDTAT